MKKKTHAPCIALLEWCAKFTQLPLRWLCFHSSLLPSQAADKKANDLSSFALCIFARLETYHAPGYPAEYVWLHAVDLAEITGRITLSWETAGSIEIYVNRWIPTLYGACSIPLTGPLHFLRHQPHDHCERVNREARLNMLAVQNRVCRIKSQRFESHIIYWHTCFQPNLVETAWFTFSAKRWMLLLILSCGSSVPFIDCRDHANIHARNVFNLLLSSITIM